MQHLQHENFISFYARNIVKIIGIGSQDMTTFTTMRESIIVVQEFMGGGNLKDMILKQMLNRRVQYYSTGDALNWLINVAEALNYLHSVCRPMIIHRDMKLENILLDKSLKEVSSILERKALIGIANVESSSKLS